MALILDLNEIQVGKESNWGTSTTLTSKLMGIEKFTVTPIMENKRLTEFRGSLAPAYMTVHTKEGAEFSFDGVVLYEDICYWLDSLFGASSPSSGAGGYTYSYAAPLTAIPTSPSFYSLGLGDGTNDYVVTSAIASTMKFTGESNSPAKFSVEGFGETISSGTLAALSDRDVNVVMATASKIYIDAAEGTVGTTELDTTAFSFEVNVDSKRHPLFHVGNLSPDNFADGKWDGELKLRLEFDTASKAYLDAILTSSPMAKLVRIKTESGTNSFQLDFAGVAEEAPKLFEDEDGVTTIELTLKGQYDGGAFANWLKVAVVNPLATLP